MYQVLQLVSKVLASSAFADMLNLYQSRRKNETSESSTNVKPVKELLAIESTTSSGIYLGAEQTKTSAGVGMKTPTTKGTPTTGPDRKTLSVRYSERKKSRPNKRQREPKFYRRADPQSSGLKGKISRRNRPE